MNPHETILSPETTMLTPMSPAQKARSAKLYTAARRALESLAEETLNLDPATRDALDETRGRLEEFDALRLTQPLQKSH